MRNRIGIFPYNFSIQWYLRIIRIIIRISLALMHLQVWLFSSRLQGLEFRLLLPPEVLLLR